MPHGARNTADNHTTSVDLRMDYLSVRWFKSEFDAEADLSFAARQELRNRAESGSLTLRVLDGRRVGVIEEVKEFKKALHPEPFPDYESLGDTQVHVHELRSGKSIATCFE